MARPMKTTDGNEACAYVAYMTNEVVAIYPITPASSMGELADAWAADGMKNIFDTVPTVFEAQAEGGAAGTCHGSLQAGALTTTFTASQGLLLMIPNMYKIAGELSPTVFHIAARSIATHALSIFGDHSDVMAARGTGWAMLASGSVQEAQDMAMVAHMATLESRVPFLHFFDGFRTSHEVNKIEQLLPEDIRALIDDRYLKDIRKRALNPDAPVLRGTAQNPDVFFQAREAINPYYIETPGIVQKAMDRFAALIGRQYKLFEYVGAPDAERVTILMGSGTGATEEAVNAMVAAGEKVGMIKVHLYRPFASDVFLQAMPKTVKDIVVLDRTKEPGAPAEPLHLDVMSAVMEHWNAIHGTALPQVTGGRYGLSSKEFTPAMVKGIFEQATGESAKNHFTVGIFDDVTNLSLSWDSSYTTETDDVTRALFYGLGSDGTVSANKNTVKIIGENTPLYAQGYFVYDSKKAGAVTVSHLRLGPRPINATYLISTANFVACHQFNFLDRMDMLAAAEEGATFLLNSPFAADKVWDKLPQETQQQIIDKNLKFYVVDAYEVAAEAKLGVRINTVMQTAFFKLSNVLPEEEFLAEIKGAIKKTYHKRGEEVLQRNYDAVDASLSALHQVTVPATADSATHRINFVNDASPDFVQKVTSTIIAGKGDLLPVSAMPVDGTFPTGTSQWEKRGIALEIPVWDADICTRCAQCSLVCPHAAIRIKAYEPAAVENAPATFASITWKSKDLPADTLMTVQVSPDDCTGCGVCVEACPAINKEVEGQKSINMSNRLEHLEEERANWDFFLSLPEADRSTVKLKSVKGSQLLQPLFEYSGACAGCGETPYVKLITQLFGERMVVANATGCSSIYGANLPTTPWSQNSDGRGPAWNNSLFEDNAEFGIGMRLAIDQQEALAYELVGKMAADIGEDLAGSIVAAEQKDEAGYAAQYERVTALKTRLHELETPDSERLLGVADTLVDRTVWIVGGDGWAYDIGYGGLDHVMASGMNVNILVLDTEVYSNTGGQASKATPRGAIAKFAAQGKKLGKKDLGQIAMTYGNVYVAQVSLGANYNQTIKALVEAEAYDGPSLVLAYSPCIAHGLDLRHMLAHQKDAVTTGYWPLFRFTPQTDGTGKPFKLDSRKPKKPFQEFAKTEARFAQLMRSRPEEATRLFDLGQQDIDERWNLYSQLAGIERSVPHTQTEDENDA